MMWGMQSWSWGGWLLMMLSMVVFWGLVIWAIVAIFRPGHRSGSRRDAEQLLAERFAAGQIDEQEYLSRLETLRFAQRGGPEDRDRHPT